MPNFVEKLVEAADKINQRSDIKVGSTVKLKVGGPQMVVEGIYHANPIEYSQVKCTYWDEPSLSFRTQTFVAPVLMLISSPVIEDTTHEESGLVQETENNTEDVDGGKELQGDS